MYQISIIDEFGERHSYNFHEYQYASLMELIRHNLGSDLGDCRGRMWCNTCAVRAIKNNIEWGDIDFQEQELLNVLGLENIRLSCQLMLTKDLHNTEWEIIDSRLLF